MRFSEFKRNTIIESLLGEVSMSPTSLATWARSSETEGMLMGIEFEMCVPNTASGDITADMDVDDITSDIDDIINFFFHGDEAPSLGGNSEKQTRHELEMDFHEWLTEQVNDYIEENPDELLDLVRDILKVDHNEKEIDKIIRDKDSNEWESAYDQAREDLEGDIRYKQDYSESNWLEAVGLHRFSDVARRYELDWPYYRHTGGELTIRDVADDFSQAIGKPVITGESHHAASRDENQWIVEPDSSIEPEDEADGGLEFISPPNTIGKTLKDMGKLWKWAMRMGCYSNESTGLHINISVPDFSVSKLDYIKLAIFMGDKYILDQFGRLGNTFCKSATGFIKQNATEENVSKILSKMRENMNTAASKLIHQGYTDKYTSINTHKGYVEFRGMGGDYLSKDPEELVHHILRLAMALQIACDENAHKKEYGKKLYKLIAPMDSNDDVVSLFSLYSTGELDKYSLVSKLQKIQQVRRAGPVQNNPYIVTNTKTGEIFKVNKPSEEEAIKSVADREQGLPQYYTAIGGN